MDRNSLEPKIEDRKKFDLDLKYGKVKERIQLPIQFQELVKILV